MLWEGAKSIQGIDFIGRSERIRTSDPCLPKDRAGTQPLVFFMMCCHLAAPLFTFVTVYLRK